MWAGREGGQMGGRRGETESYCLNKRHQRREWVKFDVQVKIEHFWHTFFVLDPLLSDRETVVYLSDCF